MHSSSMVVQISKKRRFVDGIFKGKLNEFSLRGLLNMVTLELRSELSQPGQKSLPWPQGCRMFLVKGPADPGIDSCSSEVWLLWGLVELHAEKVAIRGLCTMAQPLHYKLLGELAVCTPKFIKLYTLNMCSLLCAVIPLSSWTELCSLWSITMGLV